MKKKAAIEELKQVLREQKIPFLIDEPLKNWCTFKIGGAVPIFTEPATAADVSVLVTESQKAGVPFFVLGKGSNLLVSDNSFHGIIIHLGANMSHTEMITEDTIYSQSGAKLQQLCMFALEQGLTGMEPLYGIPGSVGGAVYMNAGAYGGEIRDIALSASYVDLDGGTGVIVGEELELSYRHSAFSDNGYIITGLTIKLEKGDPLEIRARMDDFMGRRKAKQPLEYASAGSTFKRPEGNYASALIDQCGLKGYKVGDAMVSEKHAGFVINIGGASYNDVKAVIQHVKEEVLTQKGVALDCEIKIIDSEG